MKFLALISLCTLLSGCLSTRTVTETVEVKVPVYEPCVASIPTPLALETDNLSKDQELGDKIKALLIDHGRLKTQNYLLIRLMKECSLPPKP